MRLSILNNSFQAREEPSSQSSALQQPIIRLESTGVHVSERPGALLPSFVMTLPQRNSETASIAAAKA